MVSRGFFMFLKAWKISQPFKSVFFHWIGSSSLSCVRITHTFKAFHVGRILLTRWFALQKSPPREFPMFVLIFMTIRVAAYFPR